MTTEGHETFQSYFAGIEARDLPALRHLLICPLCQQMARLLLTEPQGEPSFRPLQARPDRRR